MLNRFKILFNYASLLLENGPGVWKASYNDMNSIDNLHRF